MKEIHCKNKAKYSTVEINLHIGKFTTKIRQGWEEIGTIYLLMRI